jgi:predicted CXXCH cytochrome family protein
MSRRKIWSPLAVTAVALLVASAVAAVGVWIAYRKAPAGPSGDTIPPPALSESPYLSTRPDARYVGIAACKECHPSKHESYLHTAHSRALREPDPKTEPADESFTHAPSGRTYRVHRKDGRLWHEEVMRTPDGDVIARLDLPVRYLVGSGHFSRTYLVEDDGFLAESPITYYEQKKGWGMSPGYDSAAHLGFERPVEMECLFCHAGRVEPKPGTAEGVVIREQAIGCESCHGPGSHHAAHHRRATKHPPGTDDLTIVNPAKLSRPLQESICAACHLQDLVRVDVRGRRINEYRPGLPLNDFRINYRYDVEGEGMTVVGHFEQLRRSACYQKSKDMTCLSCHDVHLAKRPKDQTAYYRQKCLNCHETRGCSLAAAERLAKSPADDCSACHMPRGKTDVPHIAFTHHKVGRHPELAAPPEPKGVPAIVAIDDSPRLSEVDRRRNLGLAYLMASRMTRRPDWGAVYQKRAREDLEAGHSAGLRDGPTLEGLARLDRERNALRARIFAEEALARDDVPDVGRGDLLQILAAAHVADRRLDEAIALLKQLTRLRRNSEDWRILGMCHAWKGETAEAVRAYERSLAINPFDRQAHAGLADAYRQAGDGRRAREHDEKAEWLAVRAKS